jgi:preprotein translocase subunit SecG
VIYLLYTIHVIVCIFLILVVLLQQGKGADLSVFGGGTTQAAFGARGATTLLHKLTVISFAIFILTTLLIGVPQARRGTVMSDVPTEGTDSGETQLPNPVQNEQGPLTPGKGTQAVPAPAAPATPAPQPPQ